jgi:hypothetical protein
MKTPHVPVVVDRAAGELKESKNQGGEPQTYRLCLACAQNFIETIAMTYMLPRGAECEQCNSTSVCVAVFARSAERGKLRL